MCGIAGIVRWKTSISETDLNRLSRALFAQTHRGPDAKSAWNDSKIAFGHNRLSIIDLSTAANQPFHRADLKLTVVFNGEIYNYQAIKSTLESKGYEFVTTSDTEVLLVAYSEYGSNLTHYLTGMFAFVLYDWESGKIFAARDRFGEKPFFYIQTPEAFLFASELGALRELFDRDLTINREAVVDLMENMYINLHHTIYEEVEVFPPAHQLEIEKGNFQWSRYYKFPTKTVECGGFEDFKSHVKNSLYRIVESQLHADVPVATFLSSGIDSSVISAISRDLKSDILAITMSSSESHSDEAVDAGRFAKKLGIRQEVITTNPNSLRVLVDLLRNSQPLADASLIPTHLVTKSVSSHIKVMLSGDAGDEVFGSYNKPNFFLKYGMSPLPFGRNILQLIPWFVGEKSEMLLNDKNRFKLNGWMGYYSKTNLGHYFKQVFVDADPLNRVFEVAQKLQDNYKTNPEKLSFGVDMLTRLPGDFLLKVDASSMLSSLEVRSPFLDHALVDSSFSAPMKALSPNGIDKEVTRSIYRDFAGEEHQGSKKGFSIPYLTYLAGPWGEILENLLKENISSQYFGMNTSGILNLLSQFRSSPRQQLARILFSVLVLEIWLRVFHLSQDVDLSVLSRSKK